MDDRPGRLGRTRPDSTRETRSAPAAPHPEPYVTPLVDAPRSRHCRRQVQPASERLTAVRSSAIDTLPSASRSAAEHSVSGCRPSAMLTARTNSSTLTAPSSWQSPAQAAPGVVVGPPGVTVGPPGVAVGPPGVAVGPPGVVVGPPGVVVGPPGVAVGPPMVGVGGGVMSRSSIHSGEHPSPPEVLASSHISAGSTIPFPHTRPLAQNPPG